MKIKTQKQYTSFTDFLHDKSFVQWKFFRTKETNAYWNKFLADYPHLEPIFREAEAHFENIKIEKEELSKKEKENLWRKIYSYYTVKNNRTKTVTSHSWLHYAVAAGVAILILSVVFLQILNKDEEVMVPSSDIIIGNELNSKNIQLITKNRTTTFEKNIDIHIKNNGLAQVKTDKEKEQPIPIAQNTMNKLLVPYGKQSTITLPDGTRVWLNSGSTLEFPTQFHGKKREIYLSTGEIYIEVTPNKTKPFYVRTSDFNIMVHGTTFNVSTYADSPKSVILVEGSVSVTAENQKEFFLSPNEQAIYSANGGFDKKKVNINSLTSWKDGYLIFEDTPITEVLNQIKRYYNLSFSYNENTNLTGKTCTGKIILSKDLDNVMTTIALISSTTYKKINDQIYITKE